MKRIRLIALMLLFGTGVFAQRNFFQSIGQSANARQATRTVKNKGVYRLDEASMRSYLLAAPMEFKNNGRSIPLIIPLPNGETETFNIVESPVLSPAMAALYPEIKTYTGNGVKDRKAIIRISLTSSGFSAVILNMGGDAVYFERYSKTEKGTYFNYFVKDVLPPAGGLHRITEPKPSPQDDAMAKSIMSRVTARQENPSLSSTGSTLTTFRLAMPADAEFVAQNGGNVDDGYAAVVAYVNRIIAFYRKELSVSFTLVSGKNMIYTNPATDPYTNDDQVAMLDENRDNCNAVLGVGNYDIGHVWGYVGGSGGGIASLGSVCSNTQKGRGVSGEGDLADYAQVFMDQLVFHEMGHQFGMTHSYNSSIPVCTTREPSTSVEPGSGATIMSYGFTCGDDDYFQTDAPQTGPILAFHTVSYAQGVAFLSTISCGTTSATGNTAPVVTVPGSFTIPKSTPFSLTGSATDANGDALTYSWEGTNVGTMTPTTTTLANTAQPPFFRTYEPGLSGTRTYPILSAILDGSNYAKGDKLPSVGIVTTHVLTVRDNNSAGGGVSTGSVSVTIDGNSGPFVISSNLAGNYAGASSTTVTWDVNNTATNNPNVKISLSTDGGLTFPMVLLASTPNDGTESVTWPNGVTTSTARIKIEALGNIFFDISNVNFSLHPTAVTYDIAASAGSNGTISPSGTVSVASGANQSFTITPAACYKIATVMVDGVGAPLTSPYVFTNVTAAHSISVTFSPITYNISANAGPNGTITPDGVTTYNCGASQTYTITPNAGYAVQSVSVNGVNEGAITTRTFSNINANYNISVLFAPNAYTIAASAGANGSISPSGTVGVSSGGNQTFNIFPATCYKIATLVVDGTPIAVASSYTFTNVTSSGHTISATFSPITYTITAGATTNGSITPTGVTTLNCGANQTYTITPASGYSVQNVTVDGVSEGVITTRTFTSINANHVIGATFVLTPPANTATYRINAGGPAVTNSIGTFAADGFYTAANTSTSTTGNAIAGTTDDAIYQTDRFGYSNGTLNYAFPVTNSMYTVILHFAETFFNAANQRLFDVSLEGTRVLDNYDIWTKAGGINTAKTESFSVNVLDGVLNVDFSALTSDGGKNNAKVCAIEIIRTSTNVAPVANAGPDQAITLPTATTILDGSGSSDANGTISAYAWSQVSGPNTATFPNKTIQKPTISGLIAGTYVFSLIVTDNDMAVSAADQVTITVNPAGFSPTYRINAGGPTVTNSVGTFAADAFYTAANTGTSTTNVDIVNTTDDAIYQSDRYGYTNGTLNYAFPVTNSMYTVILHFAETFFNAASKRVFDVSLEGNMVLDNYDIWTKAGGLNRAKTETFSVNVTDGILNIDFSALTSAGGVNNAKVCAIEIIRTSTNTLPVANAGPDKTITLPTSTTTLDGSGSDPNGTISAYAWSQVSGPNTATFPNKTIQMPTISGLIAGTYVFSLVVTDNQMAVSGPDLVTITVNPAGFTPLFRINAGGPQVVNSIGTFSADNYYVGTAVSSYSVTAPIAGTTDDEIYQSERIPTNGVLNYAFPVGAGSGQYTVILHFAEIFFNAANQRLFDVSLEGTRVLDNYDIWAKAGGMNTAKTETFSVTVTDGTLNISFDSRATVGGKDNAKISAIEIIRTASPKTPEEISAKVPVTTFGKEADLSVKLSPNPTSNYSMLHINSERKETINLRMYNAAGALIESRSNAIPNIDIQIGSRYLPGLYYVEVMQGGKRVTVQLVKRKYRDIKHDNFRGCLKSN